jgi:putative hydrolase of HD superfamily
MYKVYECKMGSESLKELFEITEFLHKFQAVERALLVNNTDRNENDVEHSFQLAFLAWYLITKKGLDYDIEKALKYSMVHDLVEAYAGDAFFSTTEEEAKEKEGNETLALERIKREFPGLKDITDSIDEYGKKKDKEAKFVYALDKLHPVMCIYLDSGRSWRRNGVTFEMVKGKGEKIAENDDVMEVWEELLGLIAKEKEVLFGE